MKKARLLYLLRILAENHGIGYAKAHRVAEIFCLRNIFFYNSDYFATEGRASSVKMAPTARFPRARAPTVPAGRNPQTSPSYGYQDRHDRDDKHDRDDRHEQDERLDR
jgi:hypothetical protein